MAWTGLTLTVDGRQALNQAQLNRAMKIKSIVIGDGDAPSNFQTLKKLVHPLHEITELKIDLTDTGCTLTVEIPILDYDYYFREVGVVVITEDGEKLYVYDNCGDDAQYIVNTTGAETTKKRIRLSLCISDVPEIIVSNPSVLYVAYNDLNKVAFTGEYRDLLGVPDVDKVMSDTSKNAVENRVIKNYVDTKNGTNLLVASKLNITTAGYNMASFGFTEEPKNGEIVTTLLKGALGSDRASFIAYMGGHVTEAVLNDIGDGYYSATFNWKQGASGDREFRIYQAPSFGESASTIEWVKLVRGETASKEWSDGIPNKYGSAQLSGAGWRRIAKYNARGGVSILSGAFNVTVGRNYSGNNNEVHKAQIAYTHNSFKIINLLDKCNAKAITKLRISYDSNAQTHCLDLYYNSSANNLVYVKIDEGEVPTDGCWVAVSPELVIDESALSIKAEADFPTNFQVGGSEIDASAIVSGTLNVKRIPREYKQLFQGSHSLSSEQNGIKISGADLREFRDIFVNLYIQSSSGLEIGYGMPVCIALRDGYWNYQTIPVLWKAHTPYITLAITGMQAAYGGSSIEFLNVDGNGFSYETFAEDTFLFSQNKSLANVAPTLGLNFEIESVFGVY